MIAFNIILKNEENCVEECLDSIRAVSDEIVIADTGSTDKTIEICRKYTDKIFTFKWNDDFSAARNFVKRKTSAEWIFLIDADECLSISDKKKILKASENINIDGYITRTKNFSNKSNIANWRINSTDDEISFGKKINAAGWFPSEKVRLFRNKKEYMFLGRIHELIQPSILEAGGKLMDSDFYIYHKGYIITEQNEILRDRKIQFYEHLNELKMNEQNDIKSVFELAKQKRMMDKLNDAIRLFEKYRPSDSHNELAAIYMNMKNDDKAFEHSLKAVESDDKNVSALNNYALALWNRKETSEAIKIFEKIIEIDPFHSNAYYNMAVIYRISGNITTAKNYYLQTLKYNPNELKTLEALSSIYYDEKNYDEALKTVLAIKAIDPNNKTAAEILKPLEKFAILKDSGAEKVMIQAADGFIAKNDYPSAIKFYRKALNICPELIECHVKIAGCYKKLNDEKKFALEMSRYETAKRNTEKSTNLL